MNSSSPGPSLIWSRSNVFKMLLVGFFSAAFIYLLYPFLLPTLLAAIFALALKPLFARVQIFPKLHWRLSVALGLMSLLLLLWIPGFLALYKSYVHLLEISRTGIANTEVFQALVTAKTHVVTWLKGLLATAGFEERVDLSQVSEDVIATSGQWLMAQSSALASRLPGFALSGVVFLAALYLFLSESRKIKAAFLRLGVLEPQSAEKVILFFQRASYNTVVTSVIVGVVQAVLVAIGAMIFSAGDAFIVFVLTFTMSFVPVVGAGPIALGLGLYKLLVGAYGAGLGLLILAVITGTLDNILRPILMSSGEGQEIHPLISLFAIIGAVLAFGMPGLFIGPVVASAALHLPDVLFPERD